MPQGRMLNKRISLDKVVSKLSRESVILYTWCIPHLDVDGKIHADPQILKGVVVPYLKYMTGKVIARCVFELGESGLVSVYGDGYKYMKFNGFIKNQKINKNREAPSEIPDPTQELLRSCSGETPAEVKLSKDKLKINVGLFNEVWSKYPKKDGKDAAKRHFDATVKTEQDFLDINKALENYLKTKAVLKGYVKNGSTWFNQWRDFIDYADPQTAEDKQNEWDRECFRDSK